MFALRKFLMGSGRATSGEVRARDDPGVISSDTAAFAYPSADVGIPHRSVDEILAPHDELISRIKLAHGADQPTFDREIAPHIRRYAEYVHLLPATADNYFSAPGGLLRLGLEIAFFSLQATDGQIFSGRSTISVRRQLEPRWRLATFIGGLCHEVHRTLGHVVVRDSRGEEWPAYLSSLEAWLRSRKGDRYFLKWIPNAYETRSLGLFALRQIVPAETMQHLAAANSVVVPHLMASISGMTGYHDRNVLDELIKRSAALVIDRDLRASAERHGKPILGAHLERYLVDALRRLVVSNPAWQPNTEKSRVWFARDGLFLVWPNAAVDVRRLFEADQLAGIPQTPEAILEILLSAEIVEPRSATQSTWSIHPPGSQVAIEAIRFSSHLALFAGLEKRPAPLDACLLAPSAQHESAEPDLPAAPNTPGTEHATDDAPAQISLDLVASTGTTPVAQSQAGAPEDRAQAPAALRFRLNAPPRLGPPLRSALEQIVDSLNGASPDPAAWTVPQGLFVPLHQLECRRVDPAIAVRSLDGAGMLVTPPRGKAKTLVQNFGGKQIVGLVVSPRFVGGLSPDDFTNTA